MFRTQIGSVDALGDIARYAEENRDKEGREFREGPEKIVKDSAVYLRPETAQAMFVQFLNVQQTQSMKVPFGIAQNGQELS